MKKYLYFIACLFVLAACQPTEQARVFGRYVPERKDDFAWENDSTGADAPTAGGGWWTAPAVPEPVSAGLALAGIALLLKRRRA